MSVGILEHKSDRFINDVISQLSDIQIEFISTTGESVPMESSYRVIVDRLSFRYPFLRELMKGLSLGGTYVINNPFTSSLTNKFIEIQLGSRLGLPFPRTIILPDRSSQDETESLVSQPLLEQVTDEIGLPCIIKPFDGYAWEDVYVVNSIDELRERYQSLYSSRILMAQQMIKYTDYFRVFCINKRDILIIKWIPKPLAMGHYLHSDTDLLGDAKNTINTMTIQLNTSLDLDMNVVEWCVDGEGKWWIIDAFNEVPEVIPEALPHDYYTWIVNKFAECISEKLSSDIRNRVPFHN
ncbi:MAG TPA: hypothetical protein G4O16_08225 [Dehalococcoidia bacterium]|nr:hypothetical protein [Dehalococcoidia bacterium]